MSSPVLTYEQTFQRHALAINALSEIARSYFYRGKLGDAQHVLRTSLQLLETDPTNPQLRLKLLLLYAQVLVVNLLLTREDPAPLFSTIAQAQQLAEATHDQQALADALSLLGQAHCFATTTEKLKQGLSPFSPRSEGLYTEALDYQQQALQLREALHDTRGISESLFQIGIVYERWQEYDQAQEYYEKARQIAEQYHHAFEKTEPARHATIHALRQGDLDRALTLAQQALQLREEAGFKPYQPLDHLLIRDVYLAKGDEANAQRHTQQAFALAEELGLTALVASAPNIRNVLAAQQKGAEK